MDQESNLKTWNHPVKRGKEIRQDFGQVKNVFANTPEAQAITAKIDKCNYIRLISICPEKEMRNWRGSWYNGREYLKILHLINALCTTIMLCNWTALYSMGESKKTLWFGTRKRFPLSSLSLNTDVLVTAIRAEK